MTGRRGHGHGHKVCRAVGCRSDRCVIVQLRAVVVSLCEVHAARAAHSRARSVQGLDFPLKPHQPPALADGLIARPPAEEASS